MRLTIATTLLLAFLSVSAGAETVTASQVAGDEATKTAEALTATTTATEPAKIDDKKESEIPLNLDAPKKASEESHPLFKLLLAVSMMGLVGTGAYIFIRKYSKNNFAAGKNNQIKVLTQHYLGPKKSLAIIRVAGESILIGVTDTNINMIKSLALLDDEVPEEIHSNSFADLFGGVPASKLETSGRSTSAEATADSEEEEEFSIRGVKDVVSKKLKGMRSFQ